MILLLSLNADISTNMYSSYYLVMKNQVTRRTCLPYKKQLGIFSQMASELHNLLSSFMFKTSSPILGEGIYRNNVITPRKNRVTLVLNSTVNNH